MNTTLYQSQATSSRKQKYRDYLESKHWKYIKSRYWSSKLIKHCYVCKSKNYLELHHKTYKRLEKERLNDLIPLCRNCHQSVHALLNQRKKNRRLNLWNAARGLKQTLKLRKRKIRNLPKWKYNEIATKRINSFLKGRNQPIIYRDAGYGEL